jgi:hypothetical protein
MTRTGSSRRTSRKHGSNARLTAQPMHRARFTQIREPTALANRQYPDQNTIGRRQSGQFGLGTATSRPAAAYATASSRQAHTMGTVDLFSTNDPPGAHTPGGSTVFSAAYLDARTIDPP